jgi:hypothetical protein
MKEGVVDVLEIEIFKVNKITITKTTTTIILIITIIIFRVEGAGV